MQNINGFKAEVGEKIGRSIAENIEFFRLLSSNFKGGAENRKTLAS